jgi:hypothetical protein
MSEIINSKQGAASLKAGIATLSFDVVVKLIILNVLSFAP